MIENIETVTLRYAKTVDQQVTSFYYNRKKGKLPKNNTILPEKSRKNIIRKVNWQRLLRDERIETEQVEEIGNKMTKMTT